MLFTIIQNIQRNDFIYRMRKLKQSVLQWRVRDEFQQLIVLGINCIPFNAYPSYHPFALFIYVREFLITPRSLDGTLTVTQKGPGEGDVCGFVSSKTTPNNFKNIKYTKSFTKFRRQLFIHKILSKSCVKIVLRITQKNKNLRNIKMKKILWWYFSGIYLYLLRLTRFSKRRRA